MQALRSKFKSKERDPLQIRAASFTFTMWPPPWRPLSKSRERFCCSGAPMRPESRFFDLPGGFVDYRESLDEALAREVREECNLEIADVRYFGSFRYLPLSRSDLFYGRCGFPLQACRCGNGLKISDEASEFLLVDPRSVDAGELIGSRSRVRYPPCALPESRNPCFPPFFRWDLTIRESM